MTAIEIARQLAALGQSEGAIKAYGLVLHQAQSPEEELESALYILQNGGDYRVSYSALIGLCRRGQFRDDCLSILTQAFYEPNVKLLKTRYENNRKLLEKYPYLFRKDFLDFEFLPLRFYPYDDNRFVPYHVGEERFGEYIDFKRPVVSRNFFKDLDRPILAENVFSQYELEYLNDCVRPSEWVGRDNHVYLHYTDWAEFCAHLQCLNLRPLLEDEKFVFLIGDEVSQYPIDFKERFGADYSQYPVKPLGVREINRLIWHTQLSTHNGGDFFNEIFDGHPNLMPLPSVMMKDVEEGIKNWKEALANAKSSKEAAQALLRGNSPQTLRVLQELRTMPSVSDKDVFVAIYLSNEAVMKNVDPAARVVPAVFFQPHFSNIVYGLHVDAKNRTVLKSDEYDKTVQSPIFRGFKYIKTFTPMRRFTTSHGATVKFMYQSAQKEAKEGEAQAVVPDAVSQRVLNRSFMVDWLDRLYADSVLVRFEDAKLNPKATFTALAAFLDLPYTQSMTNCSLNGEVDPESLAGNVRGFDPAAVYRTYDEYVNDAERTYIEYFMRDAYEYYGYGFQYYDGGPMDEDRVKELLEGFTTIDHYIRDTWKKIYKKATVTVNDQRVTEETELDVQGQLLENQVKSFQANRVKNSEILMRGLRFVNRHGQPLHMMPRLELDPALLEQPLYH
ncbi:MAG: hypothetical protein K2P01_01470 [Oscillospiraceae bacterium]|nr:hypothetical protein [Oscillospiraceae bacterium]